MPRKARRTRIGRLSKVRGSSKKATVEAVQNDALKEEITEADCPSPEAPISPGPGQESPATYALTLDTSLEEPSPVQAPTAALVTTGLRKLSCVLPSDWVSTADAKGFYLLLLNSGDVKAVQRQIFVSFSGEASVHIHCRPSSVFDEVLSLLYSPKIFTPDSLDDFCQNILSLVEIVLQYAVCIGVDNEEAKQVQDSIQTTLVDSNPFFESSYAETCRSVSCTRLVPLESDDVRCEACSSLLKCVRERISEES